MRGLEFFRKHSTELTEAVSVTAIGVVALASAYAHPDSAKDQQLRLSDFSLPGLHEPVANDSQVDNKAIELSVIDTTSNEINTISDKLMENPQILGKFNRHPKNEDYIADLKIYYPIYKAVAQAYGLNWVDLWVIHEEETGASDDVSSNPTHYGAMQRYSKYFGDNYVYDSFYGKSLEYLKNTPNMKHWDDAQEIAAGASILSDWRNIDGGNLRKAYGSYVGKEEIGNFRYNLSQELQQILS